MADVPPTPTTGSCEQRRRLFQVVMADVLWMPTKTSFGLNGPT